jgi:adenosylmethionine-8-amino-7-oxononanoate aminotransferase
MKMYDAALLDELLQTAKANDILCIADEVLTGFGRTGKLFAGAYLTTKADIICLSKGLTGGTMALGVTASSEKIYEAFLSDDRKKTFFHGHSFTANPIACAAANASLDLLEKDIFLQQIAGIDDHHRVLISQLRESSNAARIKNIRQLGTIVAFEILGETDGYLNKISAEITERALKNGIYLRPLGNTVYLMPPYCITQAELDQLSNFLLTQLF